MNLDIIAVAGFACLAAWDGYRRTLSARAAGKAEANSLFQRALEQQDAQIADAVKTARELQVNLTEHNALLSLKIDALDGYTERNRAIMKGFIDSMTDIVRLSEEDKQNLTNRVAASKFDKKKL